MQEIGAIGIASIDMTVQKESKASVCMRTINH